MQELKFPTVAAYLAKLPEGAASYPHVTVKASVVRSSLERLPCDGLPPIGIDAFDRMVADPPGANEWVPQVHHCMLLAMIYDHHFATHGGKSAFLEWVYARNRQLLASPLYRILFMVASPQRLFVGMTNRWRAFRRGMDIELLSSEPERTQLRMTYPPHIMQELTLLGLREAFRASVEASGGHVVEINLEEVSPSECTLEGRYRKRTAEPTT